MGVLGWDHEWTFALYRWGGTFPALQDIFLFVASIFIYVLPVVLVWLFFRTPADRLKSVRILLAGLVAWQVLSNALGNLLYGAYGFRERPFAFDGIQELFFERPEKAFPSDHAAVMLAVMLAFFAYRYPKLGYLFLVGGVLSSFGRVLVGFHFVGDILGGWAIGTVAFLIVHLLERYIDPITLYLTRRLPFYQARSHGT